MPVLRIGSGTALVEKPLRQLTASEMEGYASSAMLTVGDADDLRYFWPRLVELSTSGELLTDREIVFAKPVHAEWPSWPEGEQRSIEQFCRAVTESMTFEAYDAAEVDSWICAIGRLVEDVSPYLAPLLAGTAEADENVFGLYQWNERRLPRGRLLNAFWRDSPTNERLVITFLRSPATEAAVLRHIMAEPVVEPDESE